MRKKCFEKGIKYILHEQRRGQEHYTDKVCDVIHKMLNFRFELQVFEHSMCCLQMNPREPCRETIDYSCCELKIRTFLISRVRIHL